MCLYVLSSRSPIWGRLMTEHRVSSKRARSIGVVEISQTQSRAHVKYESVCAFRTAVGQGLVLRGWRVDPVQPIAWILWMA